MLRMAYGTRPARPPHQGAASETFRDRLRKWRQREDLSQSEAALRLRISKRTLQEWEQGRAVPYDIARIAVENAIRA